MITTVDLVVNKSRERQIPDNKWLNEVEFLLDLANDLITG